MATWIFDFLFYKTNKKATKQRSKDVQTLSSGEVNQ
jgi:hypothetical protein